MAAEPTLTDVERQEAANKVLLAKLTADLVALEKPTLKNIGSGFNAGFSATAFH